jgi:hypothetical protein
MQRGRLREQLGLAAKLVGDQALMGSMRARGRFFSGRIGGDDGNSDERAGRSIPAPSREPVS